MGRKKKVYAEGERPLKRKFAITKSGRISRAGRPKGSTNKKKKQKLSTKDKNVKFSKNVVTNNGSIPSSNLGQIDENEDDSSSKVNNTIRSQEANVLNDDEIVENNLEIENKNLKDDYLGITFKDVEANRANINSIVSQFSEEQLSRYEAFRKSVLPKTTLKKILSTILDQQISPNLAIVVSGFCKVFVGEIVEMALDVCKEWGDSIPLKPIHLREAYRRYLENKQNQMKLLT